MMATIEIYKVSLLIAGPFHEYCHHMVSKYCDTFKIIVSTYKDNKNVILKEFKEKYQNNLNVTIVENDLPIIKDLHNSQNIYYQCFSATKGLEECNTQFVVKLRCDEYYSNLDVFLQSLSIDKVSTNNIFVRDVSYKPFHASDHMIVGELKLIRSAFTDLKCYIEKNTHLDTLNILNNTTPAETKIFLFIYLF